MSKKYIFTEEQELSKEILLKFPNLLNEDVILLGKPLADPFDIAQAKIHNCLLVHQEKFKPQCS